MTELEKAARQALEALEIEEAQTNYPSQQLLKAIDALRHALEQQYSATSDHRLMEQPAIPPSITCPFCESEHVPGWLHDLNMDHEANSKPAQPAQQEPVAWATQLGEYAHIQWGAKRPEYPMVYEFPLYTRPKVREPLTDEEICRIGAQVHGFLLCNEGQWGIEMARAIEAAHGIKGEA